MPVRISRWWVGAHLYEQHTCTGAFAMTQACCQPVLHSSTERLGEHFANTRIAVHWLWGSAHLYKQQTFTGAMTQACCQPVLRSSTERLGVHFLPIPELQCIGGGPVHTCMKSKHSQVYLQRHQPAVSLCYRADVHWWWIIAHLYQEQIFTCIFAMTAVSPCHR